MIRYTASVVLLLLLAVMAQQFLPAFSGVSRARILLVPLVFLCASVTLDLPGMFLLAFVCGFLWDAQNALGPQGGDPDIYPPVGSLRFGYSILLYGGMGLLMQGIRPWFRRGRWQISVLFGAIALFLYLFAEYMLLAFVRGDLALSRPIVVQMALTCALTMLFAPPVFSVLFKLKSLTVRPAPFDPTRTAETDH